MPVTRVVLGLLLAMLVGCSSEDRVTELAEVDSGQPSTDSGSVVDSTPSTTDSVAIDSVSETSSDTTPAETSSADTFIADTGPADIGTTFACGSDTCGTSLEYCKRATSPGICPPEGAGFCPAGCPGCPALAVSCETMPMKCWAKPSCGCILVEVCGSAAAGDCVEKDSGFTVGCRGV